MSIETPPPHLREDAVLAAVDLVGRTGATGIEIGYLHDDVPTEQAAWYASVRYRGTRITYENQRSPVDAAEGLARRILAGAKCVHCGRLVTLDQAGAYAHDAVLLDGTSWSATQQVAAGVCYWHRDGRVWRRGCEQRRPDQKVKRSKRKKKRR